MTFSLMTFFTFGTTLTGSQQNSGASPDNTSLE
jgi:hypothetical protein